MMVRGTRYKTRLRLYVTCFQAEFFHLLIILSSLNVHLLVFSLEALNCLLTGLSLLLRVSLRPLKFLLRISKLLVHSLRNMS